MVRTHANGNRNAAPELAVAAVVCCRGRGKGYGCRPAAIRGGGRDPAPSRERSASPALPAVQEWVAVEVEIPTQGEAAGDPASSEVLDQVLNLLSDLIGNGAAPAPLVR